MGFWPVTKKVVKDSDIVLLIADIRMPIFSVNEKLVEMLHFHKKKWILVFNKIDLTSNKYLDHIKEKYKDAYFVSGIKNMGINNLKRDLLILSKKMKLKEPYIGIVGYPNVGKSAIINAMAHRSKAAVSAKAGTTKGIQWVKAGGLMVVDSPGVVPFVDREVDLGILGAKNPERLRRKDKVAWEIIKIFKEYDIKVLENNYDVKFEGREVDDIIESIGKKKGFLLKGGIVDETRTVLQIIKDWQKGKLRF
jgi:ribosome biogenesis GTPase A